MNRLISFVFGIIVVCISAAQAMPLHAGHAGSFILSVADGCGIGVNRGPYDGCNTIYGGYSHSDFQSYRSYEHAYENDYYYAGPRRSLMVDQGQCSGRRIYRVCNVYGLCWAHCY
jgi:hypothetical protein